MLKFLLPLILATSATSLQHHQLYPTISAASPAQIRFAIENKYDDTGPGAKEPQYAYYTYKNLDDALVGYLDDPDTKLPKHEKAKAIANLYRPGYTKLEIEPPKRVDAFTGNRPNIVPLVLSRFNKFDIDPKVSLPGLGQDPFKWQKEQAVRASRLSISHYSKDIDKVVSYKPDPRVPFLDVHDKETGDLKSFHELRDGSGTIHGYYTLTEKDGRRRTVQYEADPQKGFRSTVQRIFHY